MDPMLASSVYCLPEFAQIHVHWVSDAIQPACPLSSPSPPAFPASGSFLMSRLSASGGQSMLSFSFSISPSSEYSGLISFRIDWFYLLALKILLQNHSSKTSVLWHSPYFMVQLSHLHAITGKTIALTRWTFVSKVMPLLLICCLIVVVQLLTRIWLFTLYRFVIAFLPRNSLLRH